MIAVLRLRDWISHRIKRDAPPRIYVFGDSHTVALSQAVADTTGAGPSEGVTVLRIKKVKDGKELGDESLERFCDRISRLGKDDFVFSAIGGNQYAVVSTIRHEREFTVLSVNHNDRGAAGGWEIVPNRAFKSFIESGVRFSDGPVLRRIRAATKANMFHLSPPPPKFDNAFIRRFHESRFAEDGLGRLEPTDPLFRLSCWQMQQECLLGLCQDAGVGFLPPPPRAVTKAGYLGRAFYNKDVTHANASYGREVLRQIQQTVAEASQSGQ